MKKVLDDQTSRNPPPATTNLSNEGNHCSIKKLLISLPYKGKQGENVICFLRKTLDKILPQDVEPKTFLPRISQNCVQKQFPDSWQ